MINDYNKIGLVRNPYNKAVSTYFFYKNGMPITHKTNRRKFMVYLNIWLTYLLPFWLWVLIKPLKTNIMYFQDSQGNLLVDYIGRTECLKKDLSNILDELNINWDIDQLNKVNKSTHENASKYFKFNFLRKIFELKSLVSEKTFKK